MNFLKTAILCLLALSFTEAAAKSKFLLLMGPSGCGKSTLIQHLKKLDARFEYITPLTTRPLRPGECDKRHVSLDEMIELNKNGGLLAINYIYGIYYATPRSPIDQAFSQEKFPLLDWPVEKIDIIEKVYGKDIYRVYVRPEGSEELQKRLSKDLRDKDGKRYVAGIDELENFTAGKYEGLYDFTIINASGCDRETACTIYDHFILALGE